MGMVSQRALPSAAGGTEEPRCRSPANGYGTLVVKPHLLKDDSQS